MEQMTFLDFFAGIGGFRKGFELCGMRCVGHCEIDKYADRSYRAIHDVKEDEWYAADITKVAPADLPRADLWAGGFPCQDISVAGRQRGLDGARSGLFFTLAQLVKGQSPENRPTWIVLENVKNLLSIHGGWDFATVLDTLASLGYHVEYGLLNTKYFGPPQNRERVFIVACRHPGAGRGPKIFPVPAGSGKALIQLIGGMQGQRVYDPAGISVTMAAQSGGWGGKTGLYFVDLCNGNPKLTDHARCIKARYNSGITNRGGDNSGVLISPAGMDKDAVLSFVDICTGKAKLTKEARCILSAYNRTISNWGGSSGVFYGCRAVVTPDREEKRQNGRRIKNCGEPSFTITAQDRHGVLFQDCDECPYDWMKITADAARNLFSWNSKCAATPFEISRMPAPAIRALFTACFIANGDYMVSVRKNDKGEKVFEIDDSAGKRREAFNLQMEQMMEAPGMEPD